MDLKNIEKQVNQALSDMDVSDREYFAHVEYLCGNIRSEFKVAVEWLHEIRHENFDSYDERSKMLYYAIEGNVLAKSFLWELEQYEKSISIFPEGKLGRFFRAYKQRIKRLEKMLQYELAPVIHETIVYKKTDVKPIDAGELDTEWERALVESRFF